MAQQPVVNLPAWFTDVSRYGEKGEYDQALKVVNRSKYEQIAHSFLAKFIFREYSRTPEA